MKPRNWVDYWSCWHSEYILIYVYLYGVMEDVGKVYLRLLILPSIYVLL